MQFSHELIMPNEDLPFKMFLFEGSSGNYFRVPYAPQHKSGLSPDLWGHMSGLAPRFLSPAVPPNDYSSGNFRVPYAPQYKNLKI